MGTRRCVLRSCGKELDHYYGHMLCTKHHDEWKQSHECKEQGAAFSRFVDRIDAVTKKPELPSAVDEVADLVNDVAVLVDNPDPIIRALGQKAFSMAKRMERK